MKTINLRDFYPHYTTDEFVEVPDEVAALLQKYARMEEAYRIRTYRNRAFYSLDSADALERDLALIDQPSPLEILEQRVMNEMLYKGLAALPEKQRSRIYAHFFLGMSKTAIAKAEGCHVNTVKDSIRHGLLNLKKFFEYFL